MAQPENKPEDLPVPPLRLELSLTSVGYDVTGAQGYVLSDPISHRFFRLSSDTIDILRHWHKGTMGAVAEAAAVTLDEVKAIVEFLIMSRLVMIAPGNSKSLGDEQARREHSIANKALHGYLFFRVPLFNPEPFLDWAMPFARLLVSRTAIWLVVLTGLVGAYFAFRQWDHFVTTFVDFFSPQGFVLYTATLVGLKVFHELGHGFVARSFGCRVPTIGVAFMVLTPMLYTEASDAWRLPSHMQRFRIAAAGVMVEIALAAVALFLWAFLPDGPWRSAAYFVAATAWIISIAVNLSPFMRFDGYHMLVDLLGMHNLSARAFAHANWRLRQILFATDETVPEHFPPGLARFLVAFAWGTMIYRLTLFLGIAYLVYTMFPKAVGIPLAFIEVLFFIVFPVIRELKEWYAMGPATLFNTRRGKITLALFFGLVVLAALPLDRSISVPAVMLPAEESWVYPPEPAQIVSFDVKPGDHVVEGQRLARLFVPEISFRLRQAVLRLAIVEERLKRLASDVKERATSQVAVQEREAILEEMLGLKKRAGLLQIRALQAGVISGGGDPRLPGMWLGHADMLVHITSEGGSLISGLVTERYAGRLEQGAQATFISEDGARSPTSGVLVDIGAPGSEGVALTYLSQDHGGPIMAAVDPTSGMPKPLAGYLPLRIAAAGQSPPTALRGTVTLAATPQSFINMAFGRVVTVVLRESGF